ncbi:hypothetical protein [Herbaspirillum huttiense]|uniref:hypothetical protein n=1 Tax=Herbaspirillum huttiense TaxID=863372 RepID=UPI002176A703|nr:hypothetical protein [Herbaspirillum huttiense]UWE17688.1 hypothetical protein NY669_05785 [Herbaspirillum huttiense]
MVAQEDPGSLAKRLRRLELLFATIVLSDAEGDSYDDETWFALRRMFRRDDLDPEFYYFANNFIERRKRKTSEDIHVKYQQLKDEVSALRSQVDGLRSELKSVIRENMEELQERVSLIAADSQLLQVETHSLLAIQAMGLPTDRVKVTRFVPVRAYIDQTPEGAVAAISEAVDDVLKAFGFVIADEFPEIKGSWFKKWFAKSKDFLSQPEVLQRLEKIERAVDIKAINKPQAEVDEKQANAIAKLIKCVEKIPNAAIQAGSVLVVKLTVNGAPTVQARTLTQEEMIELENNQLLLQDPAEVLSKLSAACKSTKRISKAKGSDDVLR